MNLLLRLTLSSILAWTCASTVLADEACVPSCARTEIYIIRGAAGYWPHVSEMADRMTNRGYCARVHYSMETSRLASEIVNQYGSGSSIYLIGYSLGASSAVRMARDLMAQGVYVDRLFLLECYDYPVIPPNVRCCVNLYESRHFDRVNIFRGTPARVEDPSATQLFDIDINCHPEWEAVRSNNHFTICNDPIVQTFIAQQFPDLTQPAVSLVPTVGTVAPIPTDSLVSQIPSGGLLPLAPTVGSGRFIEHFSHAPILVVPGSQFCHTSFGYQFFADTSQQPEPFDLPPSPAAATSSLEQSLR